MPQGRKGHGAVIFKNSLYIYGGKTNEGIENHSHLYELNLQTFVWKKVLTIGKAPSSRSFFSFSMFGADRIFLFGGIDNATNKVLNESYILQLSKQFHKFKRIYIGVRLLLREICLLRDITTQLVLWTNRNSPL